MLTKQKRSKFWYAVLYTAPGKKKWFSTKTTNKKEAKKIHDKLKATIDEVRNKQRVTDFVTETLQSVTNDISATVGTPFTYAWQMFLKNNTTQGEMVARRKSVYDKFTKWLSRSTYSEIDSIEHITPVICNEFMVDEFGDNADGTYNRHISEIKGIWDVIKFPLHLKSNPWEEIKRRSGGNEKSWRNFTLDEVIKILKYTLVNDITWYRACLIGYYTGLRKIDVIGLTWDQIYNTANGVFIEKKPSKTQKQKKKVVRIYLHQDLIELFEEMDKKQEYLFPAFNTKYHKSKTSRNNFSKEFTKILKLLDIKENKQGPVSFHSWRHTFATIALEEGVDIKTVGGIIGHTSPKMTERYDHDLQSGKAIQKLPSVVARVQT